MANHQGMIIDGIFASEAIDTSGEKIDVKGTDISDLVEGRGVLNYEHKKDSDAGASANDIIGHIIFAKKILKEDDCSNDRERKYWEDVQMPFVYGKAELFDAEAHPGAVAAAAVMRYYQRRKIPIIARFSIEGSTLAREGNLLTKTLARRVALTIKPCNRSCISGVVSDPADGAEKSKKSSLDTLLTRKFEAPDRLSLGSHEAETYDLIVSDPQEFEKNATEQALEDDELEKAITAGNYNVAPGTLTGGAALQVEDIGRRRFFKSQVMAAVRDWNGEGTFKSFLKSRMPEVDDSYIDHFADLVEDLHLKKAQTLEDSLHKATALDASFDFGANAKPAYNQEKMAAIAAPPAPAKARGIGDLKTLPSGKPDPNQRAPKVQKDRAARSGVDAYGHPLDPWRLTLQGAPLKPSNAVIQPSHSSFDSKTGTLHSPLGAIQLDTIKDPAHRKLFMDIVDSKRAVWEPAMENWVHTNRLMREGKMPEGVVAAAAYFAVMSKNTPIHVHEWMFSHAMDMLKEHNIKPWDPRVADLADDWLGRDQPNRFPQQANEYWEHGPGRDLMTLANPAQGKVDRNPGDTQGFQLAEDKFGSLSDYHLMHDYMRDLTDRHRDDGRAATEELMRMKKAFTDWKAKRYRLKQQGRQDELPEWDLPSVSGFAPKLARYGFGMMGMGNMVVPDTHFSRALFGLHPTLDSGTSGSTEYFKNILWNEKNSDVLAAIDKYYAKNHPVFDLVNNHPLMKQVPPEQRIFPAFWLHWLGIAPFERAKWGAATDVSQDEGGVKNTAHNDQTHHYPYYKEVNDILLQSGLDPLPSFREGAKFFQKSEQMPLSMRVAKAMHEIGAKTDYHTALFTWWSHFVPMLVKHDRLKKAEAISEQLLKAAVGVVEPAPAPVPAPSAFPVIPKQPAEGLHLWRGKKVAPGQLKILQGDMADATLPLIGVDHQHLFVHGNGPDGPVTHKLARHLEGKAYKIVARPREISMPAQLDANSPELEHLDYDQKMVSHGIDLNGPSIQSSPMSVSSLSMHRPMAEHLHDRSGDRQFTEGKRSIALHRAFEAMGIGGHVPVVAEVKHPETGKKWIVESYVPSQPPEMQTSNGGFRPAGGDGLEEVLRQGDTGNLHRLAMADWITGQNDRGPHDYTLTPGLFDGVHLIHNHTAFDSGVNPTALPHYLQHYLQARGIQPHEAASSIVPDRVLDWAKNLDIKGLTHAISKHVPASQLRETLRRALKVRLKARSGANKIADFFEA